MTNFSRMHRSILRLMPKMLRIHPIHSLALWVLSLGCFLFAAFEASLSRLAFWSVMVLGVLVGIYALLLLSLLFPGKDDSGS
jgi:hypothetical protein